MIWETGFSSKRVQCEPKASGRLREWTFSFLSFHWFLCKYLQPQGAILARQNMKLDEDFFNLALLQHRFSGFAQEPFDGVGQLCACMCNRYPRKFLYALESGDCLCRPPQSHKRSFVYHLTHLPVGSSSTRAICRERFPWYGRAFVLCSHCLRASQSLIIISGPYRSRIYFTISPKSFDCTIVKRT